MICIGCNQFWFGATPTPEMEAVVDSGDTFYHLDECIVVIHSLLPVQKGFLGHADAEREYVVTSETAHAGR